MTGTVLILGASRGLGLGLAHEYHRRGWRVIATERPQRPSQGLRELADAAKGAVRVEPLDVTDWAALPELAKRLDGTALDLLFVNAGVADDPTRGIGDVAPEEFARVMTTNALAPLKAIEALAPLVAPEGRWRRCRPPSAASNCCPTATSSPTAPARPPSTSC